MMVSGARPCGWNPRHAFLRDAGRITGVIHSVPQTGADHADTDDRRRLDAGNGGLPSCAFETRRQGTGRLTTTGGPSLLYFRIRSHERVVESACSVRNHAISNQRHLHCGTSSDTSGISITLTDTIGDGMRRKVPVWGFSFPRVPTTSSRFLTPMLEVQRSVTRCRSSYDSRACCKN
jgi:hypothetical protein